MEDPYQHGFEAMVQSYSSDSELLTHGSSPHLWLRFLQLLQVALFLLTPLGKKIAGAVWRALINDQSLYRNICFFQLIV